MVIEIVAILQKMLYTCTKKVLLYFIELIQTQLINNNIFVRIYEEFNFVDRKTNIFKCKDLPILIEIYNSMITEFSLQ